MWSFRFCCFEFQIDFGFSRWRWGLSLRHAFFFQETFLLSLQSSTYKTILALLTKITLLTLRATYSTYNTIQYSTFLHVKNKITLLHYAKKKITYMHLHIYPYTHAHTFLYIKACLQRTFIWYEDSSLIPTGGQEFPGCAIWGRHAFPAHHPAGVKRRQELRPQFPSMRSILMAAMMPVPGLYFVLIMSSKTTLYSNIFERIVKFYLSWHYWFCFSFRTNVLPLKTTLVANKHPDDACIIPTRIFIIL